MSQQEHGRKACASWRTVREMLGGRKYSIDYYQRGGKWQSKQVAEMIDACAEEFLDQLAEQTWSTDRLARESAL